MELYIVYTLVGRLFVFLLQKAPYKFLFSKVRFLQELFECDLCLGVWVYTFLAFFVDIKFLIDVPVLSQLIVGSVTSFVVHLIRIGWQDKFGTIVVN